MNSVPSLRIQVINDAPVNTEGDFILYWMTAYRRLHWNFALQRAVEWSKELGKPLVILEALRAGYRWASDRLHRFVIEGMQDNAREAQKAGVIYYYPYLEPEMGHGKGLLQALTTCAAVVITDDFPAFMLPAMVAAAAKQVPVHMEKVDSNGLLPMRTASTVFPTAYAFRRFLQKNLPEHLVQFPAENPLQLSNLPRLSFLPAEITTRWTPFQLENESVNLADLPIDHSIKPVRYRGGMVAAENTLRQFLNKKLARYADERNEPEKDTVSGLSPYLHFGHISTHQIFTDLAQREQWGLHRLSPQTDGKRAGWWGMSAAADSFLDELITWREIGFNMCWQEPHYDQFESLPEWAQQTLNAHAGDPRAYIYTLDEFERGQTHDPLWNAAQMQLVDEGRIHNYLRMLWGKKILHWSESPREALAIMIELNNKYGVDGRDPNSYSGIFWVLGRYDRPWGPERPIFGMIRYMTSENTAKKYNVAAYIQKYAPEN